MSNNYQQFVNGYLEAPQTYATRKDGVPLELLDQLTPAEKERAADALIEKLSLKDSWPIVGLGHLGSKKAAPKLYALLAEAHGRLKAEIATALWKICQDEAMLQVVLDLSRSAHLPGPDWHAHVQAFEEGLKKLPPERAKLLDPATFLNLASFATFAQIDYIYCLAQFPQPEARQRLEELANDNEYLVSYNAKHALG
jgi:hypothetical protein